jgi:hypothetical protein
MCMLSGPRSVYKSKRRYINNIHFDGTCGSLMAVQGVVNTVPFLAKLYLVNVRI